MDHNDYNRKYIGKVKNKSKRTNKTRKRTNLEVAELKIKAMKVLQVLKRAEVEVIKTLLRLSRKVKSFFQDKYFIFVFCSGVSRV